MARKHSIERITRKNGPDQFRGQMWDPIEKKPIHSKGLDTEREVADWAREQNARIDEALGRVQPTDRPEPIVFGAAIERMVEDAKAGGFTNSHGQVFDVGLLTELAGVLRNHAGALHRHVVSAVTPAQVAAIQEAAALRMPEGSVSRLGYALSLLFRWAIENGYARSNVADSVRIKKPQYQSDGGGIPTPERLDEALLATRPDPIAYASFGLAGDAGLSIGEILGLWWDEVDIDAGQVDVLWVWDTRMLDRHPPTRRGQARSSQLGPTAQEGMRKWSEYVERVGPVFPAMGRGGREDERSTALENTDRPMMAATLRKYVTQCFVDAGVEPMSFAQARLAFGRRLVERNGVSLPALARIMGYIDATTIYGTFARFTPDGGVNARRLVEDIET